MSYATIATIAQDRDIRLRCIACAATQPGVDLPAPKVDNAIWRLAASPGWSESYESALASSVERPGWDAAVISDAMILAAVQPLVAA